MDKLFRFFKTDPSYRKEVSKYGVSDGILALALYCVMMIAHYLLGLYQANTNKYLGVPEGLSLLALCFLLAFLKKDGIKSIGFKRKNAGKSILLGLVLGILTALCNAVPNLARGSAFAPAGTILLKFFYYLVVISLTEEVMFRGYIQSRIFGLIHNNAAATSVAALMFVASHIPYHMSAAGMSLIPYCQRHWLWFIDLFVLHLAFTYLYRKYNSIFASTIFHAFMDWSNDLFEAGALNLL